MRNVIYVTGILFVLIGCRNATAPVQPELGEEIKADFGKEIMISGADVAVEFVDLVEDSRCPDGVVCVWAGNAQVAIRINDEEAKLNAYLEPKEKVVSKYNVALISVDPYPQTDIEIPENKYTATIRITKE
ncbi:hypothetical protein [Fodinibius sp. Rm-B-1B1-1]|uniref:hypothetical protein n=1 Tax=Fodinibius alkaliphilus TaxID=3140241 RepID=UPI00315A4B90